MIVVREIGNPVLRTLRKSAYGRLAAAPRAARQRNSAPPIPYGRQSDVEPRAALGREPRPGHIEGVACMRLGFRAMVLAALFTVNGATSDRLSSVTSLPGPANNSALELTAIGSFPWIVRESFACAGDAPPSLC